MYVKNPEKNVNENMQPKKIYINRHPPTYRKKTMAEWRAEQAAAQQADIRQNDPNAWLCFILGFLLGPIGVIVAAIISKADGVKVSLIGLVVSAVIIAILCAI